MSGSLAPHGPGEGGVRSGGVFGAVAARGRGRVVRTWRGEGRRDGLPSGRGPGLARRKPRLLLRLPGSFLLRFATRAFLAELFQEPPRLTRGDCFVCRCHKNSPAGEGASQGLPVEGWVIHEGPTKAEGRGLLRPSED